VAPRLQRLEATFEARVQAESAGTVPEEVVVLETIGTVDNFIVAVRNIAGLEWLGEIDEEDVPPDDDFFVPNAEGEPRVDKLLRGKLFLVFSSQRGLARILSLWRLWLQDRELPYGLRKWEQVFAQLKDVRTWSVNDRLEETGVIDDWRLRVENDEEVLPCEIELWFRNDWRQRQRAHDRVTAAIAEVDGEVVSEAVIEEIRYHALLVKLPIASIRPLLQSTTRDSRLVRCEQIQFFRAAGQVAGIIFEDEKEVDSKLILEPEAPLKEPVLALFDGLPLQNHRRLMGRLVVDDPDDYETNYEAKYRCHGTAMASLILHGDIEAEEIASAHKIYMRPILRPDALGQEMAREDELFVDLLHRSVRRLFEGDGEEDPASPEVCIINLSIGIRDRLFDNSMSPLARLLDWLAWKYQVLFLISAGNHMDAIECDVPRAQIGNLAPQELQAELIKAVASGARNRRLLSPAESVNGLTVGAIHDDASIGPAIPGYRDPFVVDSLPSLVNAQGMGYRRAVKPELLAPGGRIVLRESYEPVDNAVFDLYQMSQRPGQCVAAPGVLPGNTNNTCYTRGTSGATAIASRSAVSLFDVLQELRNDPGGDIIDIVPYAVWLKALLTHSASWGSTIETLREILGTPGNRRGFREYITRLLGYGVIDAKRVRECTQQRVTALGGGFLQDGEAHIQRFPLPPSLSGNTCWRRLTITLGWITPINTMHQGWRRAHLSFEPPTQPLQVARHEVDAKAALRGTVQHEVLEGERAADFIEGQNLEIKVNCRADAGVLEDAVPYAMAATLEIPTGIGIDIYDEVNIQIRAARVAVIASE